MEYIKHVTGDVLLGKFSILFPVQDEQKIKIPGLIQFYRCEMHRHILFFLFFCLFFRILVV